MKRTLSSILLTAFFGCITHPLMSQNQNVSHLRAVYQSGSIDDHKCGHLITDGSDKTYWEGRVASQNWVYTDLGVVTPVEKVRIDWGENFASTYKIQYSNEKAHPKSWTDIFVTTNGKGGIEEISIPKTDAKNIRILILSTKTPNKGVIIKELEIIGRKKSQNTQRTAPFADKQGDLVLKDGNWKCQNAMFVDKSAEHIASAQFDDSDWIPALVPGTILGSYLEIGALPDPYFGDQTSMISEEFFSKNDFWYRNSFTAPTNFKGKRIFLNFDGINWKSDIYLNGEFIGKIDGAFMRGRFDVTELIQPGKENYLSLLIKKLDHTDPGEIKVTHKYIGSRTTNGDILGYDSPTYLASAGWNWLPIIRGRNLGIWDEVRLEARGDVELIDPWVNTTMNLPDTTVSDLQIMTELKNHTDKTKKGYLVATIGDITIRHSIELKPDQTQTISLDKHTYPQLSVKNPKLWWPNGYGQPNLYNLDLKFESSGKISDQTSVTFGIREVDYVVNNNIIFIYVNGKRILLRGGNWGMAEGMLNCDDAGYDLRVKLHRDANFNMIRNWVGMTGDMTFYDVCDRYGILIFDDFWLANPVDGPEPLDTKMFISNVEDKIRRVRSHPSLAFYCGRNEGNPPANLDKAMQKSIDKLDSTRHYVPHSADGTLTGLGPYDVMSQEWYFENRGITFHSEQGIIAIPTAESIKQMMPEENWWPINDMWAVHDYQTPRSLIFTKTLEHRFGIPESVDEYAKKAQMLNMESSKAMFECLQNNQGSGLLLWMSQAAWPSLICQLYDHYFEPTSSYFGVKRACEPVHILWNPLNDMIRATNNTPNSIKQLVATAEIIDLKGVKIWSQTKTVDMDATSAVDCFKVPVSKDELSFIKLILKQGERIIAENFYWTQDSDKSCKKLLELPEVKLKTSAVKKVMDGEVIICVTLKNESQNTALMARLKVHNKTTNERILPVFYSDNYVSLLPGEEKVVKVNFDEALAEQAEAIVLLEGWNIEPMQIILNR